MYGASILVPARQMPAPCRPWANRSSAAAHTKAHATMAIATGTINISGRCVPSRSELRLSRGAAKPMIDGVRVASMPSARSVNSCHQSASISVAPCATGCRCARECCSRTPSTAPNGTAMASIATTAAIMRAGERTTSPRPPISACLTANAPVWFNATRLTPSQQPGVGEHCVLQPHYPIQRESYANQIGPWFDGLRVVFTIGVNDEDRIRINARDDGASGTTIDEGLLDLMSVHPLDDLGAVGKTY